MGRQRTGVTALLELVGTACGTWAAVQPVTALTSGNPPSAIAAGYCLVDLLSRLARLPVRDDTRLA